MQLVSGGDGFDEEDTVESISDSEKRQTMVAIAKAWENDGDEFCLYNVNLYRSALDALLHKWGTSRVLQQSHGTPSAGKIIKKIVLESCWFGGSSAAQLMIIFLNKIGQDLKQLYIRDGAAIQAEVSNHQKPLGSILSHLQFIVSLECLELKKLDLRGKEKGFDLRCILAQNDNLEVLQLAECLIDDDMFEQFLIGLQYHLELRYLDLRGWRLTVKQTGKLVDALLYCSSKKNFQLLDISGSPLENDTLRQLSRLPNVQILHDPAVHSDDDSSTAQDSTTNSLVDTVTSAEETSTEGVDTTGRIVDSALSLMLCA